MHPKVKLYLQYAFALWMLCWCFKQRHACVQFHFNIMNFFISIFTKFKKNIEYKHTVVINYIHINCFCCWIICTYIYFLIERNTIFFFLFHFRSFLFYNKTVFFITFFSFFCIRNVRKNLEKNMYNNLLFLFY